MIFVFFQVYDFRFLFKFYLVCVVLWCARSLGQILLHRLYMFKSYVFHNYVTKFFFFLSRVNYKNNSYWRSDFYFIFAQKSVNLSYFDCFAHCTLEVFLSVFRLKADIHPLWVHESRKISQTWFDLGGFVVASLIVLPLAEMGYNFEACLFMIWWHGEGSFQERRFVTCSWFRGCICFYHG